VHDHIQQYKLKGYQPIANNTSGIGAEVLFNASLDRIVKFGQDPAYDIFVVHAMASGTKEFPKLLFHDKPAGPFVVGSNDPYTVTEMEHLSPLTSQEAKDVIAWFSAVIEARRTGQSPHKVPDPFGLTSAYLALEAVAIRTGVGLDLQKSTNYMARVTASGREIVFTDPYN